MAARTKTSFDTFLEEECKNPEFREEFERVSKEIRTVDALIRALDDARALQGMSKAALARELSMKPEAVRRLFSAESPNPTLNTMTRLADVLGYRLQLVPKAKRKTLPKRNSPGCSQATGRGVVLPNSSPSSRTTA